MNARKTYVAPELELFEVRSEERFTSAGCKWVDADNNWGDSCTTGDWYLDEANTGGSF